MAPQGWRRHPEKTRAMQDFCAGYNASAKEAALKQMYGEISPDYVAGFVFATSGQFMKTPTDGDSR